MPGTDHCEVVDENERGDKVCQNQTGNQAPDATGDLPYGCYYSDYQERGQQITERARDILAACVANLPED
jgi:hypothetical protein